MGWWCSGSGHVAIGDEMITDFLPLSATVRDGEGTARLMEHDASIAMWTVFERTRR